MKTRISHILIDREEHGYDVMGIKKLALNGQSTAQIFMSDVRVPVSNTLGEQGQGLKNTMKLFEYARCHMAMGGVATARRALDESIKVFPRPVTARQADRWTPVDRRQTSPPWPPMLTPQDCWLIALFPWWRVVSAPIRNAPWPVVRH